MIHTVADTGYVISFLKSLTFLDNGLFALCEFSVFDGRYNSTWELFDRNGQRSSGNLESTTDGVTSTQKFTFSENSNLFE